MHVALEFLIELIQTVGFLRKKEKLETEPTADATVTHIITGNRPFSKMAATDLNELKLN